MKLLHVQERSKLRKILGVKICRGFKRLKFFIELVFPILCYGCRCPGVLFCRTCFRGIHVANRSGRCFTCFQNQVMPHQRYCDECSASIHQTIGLYCASKEAHALYAHAAAGKAFALKCFIRAVKSTLALEEFYPKRIVYFPSSIPRDFPVLLAKELQVPCQMLLPFERCIRRLKPEPVCIISTHLPSRKVLKWMRKHHSTHSILISLFAYRSSSIWGREDPDTAT